MSENPREIVLELLIKKSKGLDLSHKILDEIYNRNLEDRDKAFIIKVYKGTVANRIKIDYIINNYLKNGKKPQPIILNILRMSIYQIIELDSVKDYAIINEAVELVKKKGKKQLCGFVNALLRRVSIDKDSIKYPEKKEDTDLYLSIKYSMPTDIIKLLKKQYNLECIEKILDYSNKEHKTVIRVMSSKIDFNSYLSLLDNNNILYEINKYISDSVILPKVVDIKKIPGYNEGYFIVQDTSSQLVSELVGAKNNIKVLDLCASPGGKTISLYDNLLKHYGENLNVEFISQDKNENKLLLLRENINRVGFNNIKTLMWDALILKEDYIEKFDIVLLDVPCSGLGVMSKKSDLRYNQTSDSIENLIFLQNRIIDNAIRYVKKGGKLIYSTCTINNKENQLQIDYILEKYNFKLVATNLKFKNLLHTDEINKVLLENKLKDEEILILPGKIGSNGGYMAVLVREK